MLYNSFLQPFCSKSSHNPIVDPAANYLDGKVRADLNIVEETKIIEYNLVGEQVTTEVYYNRLPDLSELSKYMGLCWFTGDDEETSLIAEEQPLISSYLPVNIRMVKIT